MAVTSVGAATDVLPDAPAAEAGAPAADGGAVATRVAVIAHGSPDDRHAASVRRTAARISAALGCPVDAGFLEHDAPRADRVVAPDPRIPMQPTAELLVVVPLLLTAGYHWRQDIPPLVAHAGRSVAVVAPPRPVIFAAAIDALLPRTARHVLLASAGSSRSNVAERFAELADRLAARAIGRRVDVALSVDEVRSRTTAETVVVPTLTADGVFADRIRQAAAARGAAVTPVLGDTESFARRLAELIADHRMGRPG